MRALDLGVPVRAFDEANGDAPARAARKRLEPAKHVRGAFLIGLHREPEPLVARERRIFENAREDRERELEPIGLFRVDRELYAARARGAREIEERRGDPLERAGACARS